MAKGDEEGAAVLMHMPSGEQSEMSGKKEEGDAVEAAAESKQVDGVERVQDASSGSAADVPGASLRNKAEAGEDATTTSSAGPSAIQGDGHEPQPEGALEADPERENMGLPSTDVDALGRQMETLMQSLEAELEDDELTKVIQDLKSLLIDQGRFHDLCEQGFTQEKGGKLATSADLRDALNVIARDVGLDDVTMDEADDLWIPDLNNFEYYTLAKRFFESISRSLDEENDNLIMQIAGAVPGAGGGS
ncbi:unnamed protein product [Amoebophrya sp. A25]|nr:unnamed protein product [Amoebophrya sp. A25]|eukprot:GSA25T00000577001.1